MNYLSDLIARLENGQRAEKAWIYVKKNKISLQVLQILQNEGLISHQTLVPSKTYVNFDEPILKKKNILLSRRVKVYFKKPQFLGTSRTQFYSRPFHISRVSKSSRRIQMGLKNLWKLDRGFGLQILSTSRGLLTDRQARIFKVGGELLCKVR